MFSNPNSREILKVKLQDRQPEAAKRYRGLSGAQTANITADSTGLVVKPETARKQMTAEAAKEPGTTAPDTTQPTTGGAQPETAILASAEPKPRRFHGTVRLDSARVGRDASRIADEVISHLAGQDGEEVTVTLEINAKLTSEATDQLVRIVSETAAPSNSTPTASSASKTTGP